MGDWLIMLCFGFTAAVERTNAESSHSEFSRVTASLRANPRHRRWGHKNLQSNGPIMSSYPIDEIDWFADLEFDENNRTQLDMQFPERMVTQIAHHVGESVSFQEAVRMAVSQGVFILRNDPHADLSNLSPVEGTPEPNCAWFNDIEFGGDGSIRRKVTFTRHAMEQVAELAGHAPDAHEAIRLLINQALYAQQTS